MILNSTASESALDFNGTTSALYFLDNQRPRGLLHYSYNPITLFPKPGTHFQRHSQHITPHQHQHRKGESNHVILQSARTESHFFVDDSVSTPISHHAYPSPGSFSTSQIGSIAVQVIPASYAPELGLDSQLETPLLGSASNHAEQENKPPPFMPPLHSPPPPHKSTMSRNEGDQGSRPQQRHSGGIATISSVRNHGKPFTIKCPLIRYAYY